jgi:hypothetical protein
MAVTDTMINEFISVHLKQSIDVTSYNGKDETLKKAYNYLHRMCLSNVQLLTEEICEWDAYHSTLNISSGLETNLVKPTTRYIVALLYLTVPDFETESVNRHVTALIFDCKIKHLEYFDPIGYTVDKYCKQSLFAKLKSQFTDYNLIELADRKEGMQTLQCLEPIRRIHYNTDPPGFCAAWVIWYIDARFSNPTDNPIEQLSSWTDILSSIKYETGQKKPTLRGFIRNYSHYIMTV